MVKKTLGCLFAVLVCITCFGPSASIAAWPERPISIIVPASAGGGTDFNARLVAKILEKDLKVPVNCINRTGGGGVVGHQAIADAAPDGYTIGYLMLELSGMHWAGLTNLDYRNYALLGQLTSVAGGIFVQTSSPYKTADDLLKAVKANPGKLKASGSGLGGPWHLALAGMLEAVGMKAKDVVFVPMQGAAPSLLDLVAGGLDLVVCAPAEARAMLDAGKVRGLAYLANERNPVFPNIPTFKEATGSSFTLDAWGGVGAPKGLPNDVNEKLVQAIKRVYDSNEFKDVMMKAGKGITYKGPKEFFEFLAEMDKNYGNVMKAVGIAK